MQNRHCEGSTIEAILFSYGLLYFVTNDDLTRTPDFRLQTFFYFTNAFAFATAAANPFRSLPPAVA